MTDLWLDLKFGARMLLRNPLITLVAALSLGIGVGANTTVFTLVKAVFLEPLPVEDASTLVSVYRTVTSDVAGAAGGLIETAFANYEDARDRSASFDDLMASTFGAFSLSEGEPEQLFGGYATTNYFRTLGLEPVHGRLFVDADERELVAVLSHGLWSRRFGADSDLVGRTIRLNGLPFTVIGIAPPGFKGPFTLANQELWVPVHLYPRLNTDGLIAQALEHRGLRLFNIIGRLRAGVSAGEAEAELQNVATGLEEEHPDWNRDRGFAVLSLSQATLNPNQRGLYVRAGTILMAAVGLVLIIACANVATLLLSRSRARLREIAMRLSLGATRSRVARQLLTEAMLLAALGGALGTLVALWTRPLLWQLRPPFLPEGSLDLSLDPTVLAFTTIVALAAGLVFGTAPAWQSSRIDLVAATKSGEDTRGARAFPLRQAIVAGQAALSLIALAAAGLFVISLDNAYDIDPGFDHDRLAIAAFDLGAQGYTPEEVRTRFARILEQVPAIAGVERAALGTAAPLSFSGSYRVIPLGAEDRVGDEGLYVANNSVSPDYFRTIGLSTTEGRVFDTGDTRDSRHVVVVNETFAETFWPGESALGRQVRWPAAEAPWDIVGVVPDVKYESLGEAPKPYFYRPLEQEPGPFVTLHVRTNGAPDSVLLPVQRELRSLDPNVPVRAITLHEAVRESLWAARLGAALLSVFGILAVSLAAVGIYGVLAHAIELSRRELGIRMALGARRSSVISHVLRRGLSPVAVGIAGGAVAALSLRHLADEMLYGMAGRELTVLVGAAVALGAVATVACLIPAWRTTTINPVETLKAQ